jgi:hypothetical protein
MGRLFFTLDPSGLYYATEPGFHWRKTGAKLAADQQAHRSTGAYAPIECYSPPDSDWVLPKPVQFYTQYPRANDWLGDCVLRKSLWTFGTDVTATEFEPTRKAEGSTLSNNQWISIARLPTSITSLAAISFSAMETAAGIDFPSGMGVIGFCPFMPNGTTLISTYDFMPFVQYATFPSPDGWFVFGFGNLAFICGRETVHLVRTPDNSWQNWEPLGQWRTGGSTGKVAQPGNDSIWNFNMFQAQNLQVETSSFLCLPEGFDHLRVFLGGSQPQAVRLRKTTDTSAAGRLLSAQSWWVAGFPKQRLMFQAAVVGYSGTAVTVPAIESSSAARYFDFDLGGTYKPSVAPEFAALYRIHDTAANISTDTSTPGRVIFTSSNSGERVTVTMEDENEDPWESDGTKGKGNFVVEMGSTSGDLSTYFLAPQVQRVELRFPPVLTARSANPNILDDTQVAGFKVASSLYDPTGKRIHVDFPDKATAELVLAALDGRGDYPLAIHEDTDASGSGDTLRAAGWIMEPELSVILTEGHPLPSGGSLSAPVQRYRLSGSGFMEQLNAEFLHLPQLTAPAATDGKLEATDAVEEVVKMFGVDTSDTARWIKTAHAFAGTLMAVLPGTGQANTGEPGQRFDGPWAPDWDQSGVSYCETVAKEWLGWVFYEDLTGRLRLHPDLGLEMLFGTPYYRQVMIYNSAAEALAAGANRRQVALELDRVTIEPTCNAVRVTGKDAQDGKDFPSVIEVDSDSLTNVAYDHFIGRLKPKALVSKMAVSKETASIFARWFLNRFGRRRYQWTVTVPRTPWDLGMDVGYVFGLDNRGDFLCTHLEFTADNYNLPLTRLTGEMVPAGATRSITAGAWPGVGV